MPISKGVSFRGDKTDTFKDLVIAKPHPLLCFGVYHPFYGLPPLKNYKGIELSSQLRKTA
jgi:hypothetical protein